MRLALFIAFVACISACENAGAPAQGAPAELCEHLCASGCPQGDDENCVENNTPTPHIAGHCEGERNELPRCYWLDLPADSEEELATDPFRCVVSDSCQNESEALCFCERGLACGVDT